MRLSKKNSKKHASIYPKGQHFYRRSSRLCSTVIKDTMEDSLITPTQPTPPETPPSIPIAPVEMSHAPVGIPPKKKFDLRYLFIGMIVVAIIGGIIVATWTPRDVAIAPTPTPTPSPTPVQRVTVPLATESAYRELVTAIASLSGSIQRLETNDTTLAPPVIELPLGFSN